MDEQKERLAYDTAVTTDTTAEQSRHKGGVLSFWRQALFGLGYALLGYFFGAITLPFGARPLGIALLCGSDRRIFYIYAGLLFSAWWDPYRHLLIGIYSALLMIRLLVRFVLDPPWGELDAKKTGERTVGEVYPLLFSEHLSLRMSSACLGVFAFGIYRLVEGGFLYYDLYGTILSAIAAPTCVLLFGGYFSTDEHRSPAWRTAGILALCTALVFGLGAWKLWGISLAVLVAMFLTFYLTRTHGVTIGLLAGTLLGLAVSVELAPAFAFAALASGLLLSLSPALAMSAAFAAATAWGFYAQRLALLNGTLSSFIVSGVLFFVWDKLFLEEKAKPEALPEATAVSEDASQATTQIPLWELRLAESHRRTKRICESLSSLSSILHEVAKQAQAPSATDLRELCERAFEDSCTGCPQKTECWREGYRTAAEIGEISAVLHLEGRVEMHHAGNSLRARCARLPDILEEINHNAAAQKTQRILGDRTEVFAMDYGALSELLATAMVDEERECTCDTSLSEALRTALAEASIPTVSVGVFGTRRRRVRICLEHPVDRTEKILDLVRLHTPFLLDCEQANDLGDGVIELWERAPLSVTLAQRSLLAEGEETYCGDTAGSFYGEDGRFFALISDGMGSGQEAAMTSGLCAAYLRKMIDAGCPCEMAVRMLGGFLRNRGSGSLHECSATVDLLELDLMQGKASFYKSGAAPTYVLRGGGIIKLRARTVPVGILRESDVRKIAFDVTAGDTVVMVSDGVTQGKEECPRLFDLLHNKGELSSPERIADLVVKYAKGAGSSDDLSVLVIKIA